MMVACTQIHKSKDNLKTHLSHYENHFMVTFSAENKKLVILMKTGYDVPKGQWNFGQNSSQAWLYIIVNVYSVISFFFK